MSAVDRTGAPEPHLENRPSRNQDFKHPLRLLAQPRHPVSRSTWPPDGSRSAQHAHRRPIYVSFVSKAILWDRGHCHYTTSPSISGRAAEYRACLPTDPSAGGENLGPSSLARKCPQRRPPGGPLVGVKGPGHGDLPLLSEPCL
ncbi:flocculation protein FLO11-like protein [Lates japonicus]|uniref:Flocculation protein FLO11-like protein n=1 Tax=Lates japonicus TaxID=270547 RepID=A0AAD3QYG0_LATJO|nr:flocculation protein FLO11-like protein [Lates japonicus]